MPTSLTDPIGAPSPDAVLPASTVTASGETPVPWICRLQRMQLPASGMLWRSGGGGCGGGPVVRGGGQAAAQVLGVGGLEWGGGGDPARVFFLVVVFLVLAGRGVL